MKSARVWSIMLVIVLALLLPFPVFAEGDSSEEKPDGFQMSYGYEPLTFQGADAADYVKGPTPETSYVKKGESYTVAANSYTFRDYVFAGWSSGGKLYQPGEIIYNVSTDMKFVAKWTRPARPEMVIFGVLSYNKDGKVLEALSVQLGTSVTVKEGTWLDESGRAFKGGDRFLLSATTADLTAGTAPDDAVKVKYSGAKNGYQCPFTIKKGGSFIVDGCYEKRDGFTFTGWQCGERVYLAGDTCIANDNMELTAIWRENTKPAPDYCTVTISTGTGGSASPEGKSTVITGESFTFTVKADEYYALESVLCNGQELGTNGSYTITVNKNTDVRISFKAIDKPQPPEDSMGEASAEDSTGISDDTSNDDGEDYSRNWFTTLWNGFTSNLRKIIAFALAFLIALLGVSAAIAYTFYTRKK